MKRVKWLALTLLLVMGMTFAACGDGGSSGEKSSKKESKKKTSYESPLNDLADLINKQSTDVFAYQKCIMVPMQADYNKALYDVLKKNEDVKDDYEDMQEDIKDFYSDIKGFKITKVDIVDAEEMKNKEVRNISGYFSTDYYEDLLEQLDDLDDSDYKRAAKRMDISESDVKKIVKATKDYYKEYSKAEVTEGYYLTVRFYGKYDGDEDKTEKYTVQVIKINGEWYIYNAYDLFAYGFSFSDDLDDISMYQLYRYLSNYNLSNMVLY